MVLMATAKGLTGEVTQFTITGRENIDYGIPQYCTITINCGGTDVTFKNICQKHVTFSLSND